MFPQRFAYQRTDREVRNVVIVHDVKMDDISASIEHGRDVFAQAGEIRGQNRRSDQ
jgi:hypothetical protein